MYVRKFEADTLEEALKNIKRELGPDAIVLKTVTNKGLKGAFKKKKIEITAAISEKNYTDKAKVDQVLTDDQKDKFYQGSSSHVAQQIKGYNEQTNQPKAASGYGNMGLNRAVKSVKNDSNVSSSLDNFLTPEPKVEVAPAAPSPSFDSFMSTAEKEVTSQAVSDPAFIREEFKVETPVASSPVVEAPAARPTPMIETTPQNEVSTQLMQKYEEIIQGQNEKIENLEARVLELVGIIENYQSAPSANNNVLKELRNKLRALGVSEEYIQKLVRKISFEFESTSEENFDEILDHTLNEMMNSVQTKMPLFSASDDSEKSTITLFISDSTCGQTSMVQKIASLCPDSQIVTLGGEKESNFTTELLGLDVKHVSSPSEIVTTCRKNNAEGINTFVDYRSIDENDNFKKFVKGLKRSFEKVEVFTTISAIHTETYNESVLNKYEDVTDGTVINFVDHCLDYGMLFNLNQKFQDAPFVFYGNGDTVPDDVEAATAERILAGMFRIK
jgi:flagellar biosynthesis protein FlhF